MTDKEYDYIPFLFTETLYYIDPVESEWEIAQQVVEEKNTTSINEDVSTRANTVTKVIEKKPSEKKPSSQTALAFMGRNRKAFLILVEDEENEFVSEADSELIGGILRAGNLSLADVAIVNVFGLEIDFLAMYNVLQPEYVLNFGTDLKKLHISYEFELYEAHKIKNITWLSSEKFKALHQDKKKKFQLWQGLKQLGCYQS